MDLAQRVKLYVFYGMYRFVRTVRKDRKTQTKPVLHAIHNILTQYRSRYVNHVEKRIEMRQDPACFGQMFGTVKRA